MYRTSSARTLVGVFDIDMQHRPNCGAGTLIIELTESESKAEIDRFCEAMNGISRAIAEVEAGRFAIDDSALRPAPRRTSCTTSSMRMDPQVHP